MDSQWLKMQFRRNPQLSKADLARALSLEPPAISKILSGNRQIKAQEYIEMRKFFGLPLDPDRAGRQTENSVTLEPLDPVRNLHEKEQGEGNWTMPASLLKDRTVASPDQVKIFSVNESVMEPDYKKGEHVVVDLSDKRPSPPGIYVVSDGFGFMLRHCAYIPKSSPPSIKLTATQKSFQPQMLEEGEFTIIGRVIAKLQWI